MREISKCEEQTMLAVWKSEEAPDLQQIVSKVNATYKHEWKPQTVSTFLIRLRNKGYLTAQKKGRYTYYYPAITLEQYRQNKIKDAVELYYGGNAVLMLEQIEDIRKQHD